MKIKGKSVFYWLAWAPLALMGAATIIGVGLGLAEAISESPLFVIGGLIFLAWLFWGFLYLRTDIDNDGGA